MHKHYKITVRGIVQEVFFRVSTSRQASKLKLLGFVRNEPDGSVYIEVEGEQASIDQLITWIRAGGPPSGQVNDLIINQGNIENYKRFEIR